MKTVTLKTPLDRIFNISGSEKDRSIIGAIESNGGYYELNIMRLLKKMITPGSICIDVGANVGVISLCLGHLASKGKVFAFEASEHNFTYLVRNIIQNNCSTVLPLNYGILNDSCTVNFSYVEEVAGCSFISNTGVTAGISEQIRCISLDTWIESAGIQQLDFIKMDVEGAEIKALNGGMKTLEKFKPDMIIEFNPVPMKRFFGEDPVHLFNLLQNIYEHIYLISETKNELIKIEDYEQIQQILHVGKGWEDLFCTFKSNPQI